MTRGEMILDLKTETCHFVRSNFYQAQSALPWKDYIRTLADQQVLYYIDAEKVLQEADIDCIRKRLAQTDHYGFCFRVNSGQHFEWFMATVTAKEKSSSEVVRAEISIESQGLFNVQSLLSNTEFLREILLAGFGCVYSNMIWIDVEQARYKIINQFGTAIDLEVSAEPVGTYEADNKGYAINFVYQDDWDTFWKYTSLQWYRDHLKKAGDHFSFLIRHIYNGEYRWVEINTVCTKRDAEAFHVFYWLDDVNDKVYDNTAMKDTLASVEVGQWRFELKNDGTETFTASPSLLRILGVRESEENGTLWNDIKQHVYWEDREKVKQHFSQLANNEETSFSFRFDHRTKGLRYYRCGMTCVAKNDIYTCYQGYGQDITDIMQPMVTSVKQAEAMSFIDQLTGLHNRNYMESRSEQFMRAGELPVSLIMADCNYLKRTNDTLGHEYGDLLLQRVAESIRACLPENSVAMRIGGDEFLILCAHCPAEKAAQLVASIRQRMAASSTEMLKLSASFGICTVENTTLSFRDAYDRADRAMYQEKEEHHKHDPRP